MLQPPELASLQSILSPGFTPKCSSSSLRMVTGLRTVTVRIGIRAPPKGGARQPALFLHGRTVAHALPNAAAPWSARPTICRNPANSSRPKPIFVAGEVDRRDLALRRISAAGDQHFERAVRRRRAGSCRRRGSCRWRRPRALPASRGSPPAPCRRRPTCARRSPAPPCWPRSCSTPSTVVSLCSSGMPLAFGPWKRTTATKSRSSSPALKASLQRLLAVEHHAPALR